MEDNQFTKKLSIRWADCDPNFHVRHSVYYDWCATIRLELMLQLGISYKFMMDHKIGPVLLREEAQFRSEIKFGDVLKVNTQIVSQTDDAKRWTFQHEIKKNDNIVAAIITVDGGWLNLIERKLTPPPLEIKELFYKINNDI